MLRLEVMLRPRNAVSSRSGGVRDGGVQREEFRGRFNDSDRRRSKGHGYIGRPLSVAAANLLAEQLPAEDFLI